MLWSVLHAILRQHHQILLKCHFKPTIIPRLLWSRLALAQYLSISGYLLHLAHAQVETTHPLTIDLSIMFSARILFLSMKMQSPQHAVYHSKYSTIFYAWASSWGNIITGPSKEIAAFTPRHEYPRYGLASKSSRSSMCETLQEVESPPSHLSFNTMWLDWNQIRRYGISLGPKRSRTVTHRILLHVTQHPYKAPTR